MVSALVRHFIAIVARRVQAVVPVRLSGVNAVAALSGRHLKAGAVKEVEFKFRPDDHSVRNSVIFHIMNRTQGHVFRVLVEGLIFALSYGAHIAAHGQGRDGGEGVHTGGIRVRKEHHVAFFNGGIAIVGAVEADAVGEGVLAETLHRNGDVPPAAVDVRHLEIDHADLLFLAQVPDFRDFSRVLIHAANSFSSYRILYSREQ